jgi:hypothetical protein
LLPAVRVFKGLLVRKYAPLSLPLLTIILLKLQAFDAKLIAADLCHGLRKKRLLHDLGLDNACALAKGARVRVVRIETAVACQALYLYVSLLQFL